MFVLAWNHRVLPLPCVPCVRWIPYQRFSPHGGYDILRCWIHYKLYGEDSLSIIYCQYRTNRTHSIGVRRILTVHRPIERTSDSANRKYSTNRMYRRDCSYRINGNYSPRSPCSDHRTHRRDGDHRRCSEVRTVHTVQEVVTVYTVNAVRSSQKLASEPARHNRDRTAPRSRWVLPSVVPCGPAYGSRRRASLPSASLGGAVAPLFCPSRWFVRPKEKPYIPSNWVFQFSCFFRLYPPKSAEILIECPMVLIFSSTYQYV